MEQKLKFQDQEKNANYQRLAIKGFDWLDEDLTRPAEKILGSTGFRSFKIEDEKKKWKKKKCKCFQGLGQKIQRVIESNPRIKQQNTNQIKKELFKKVLEKIDLKNNYQKVKKISKVSQIYNKEKNYRINTINDYFDHQIQWIKNKTT